MKYKLVALKWVLHKCKNKIIFSVSYNANCSLSSLLHDLFGIFNLWLSCRICWLLNAKHLLERVFISDAGVPMFWTEGGHWGKIGGLLADSLILMHILVPMRVILGSLAVAWWVG